MNHEIRNIVAADLDAVKSILNSTELFPPEALDAMIAPYLAEASSDEIWFAYISQGAPVAFGYCVHEELTDGTYNLLAIAVDAHLQGKGIGTAMIHYLEQRLKAEGNRILIVETSGDPAYAPTRRFYERLDYTLAATISDFWKVGEDKLVYYKKLMN